MIDTDQNLKLLDETKKNTNQAKEDPLWLSAVIFVFFVPLMIFVIIACVLLDCLVTWCRSGNTSSKFIPGNEALKKSDDLIDRRHPEDPQKLKSGGNSNDETKRKNSENDGSEHSFDLLSESSSLESVEVQTEETSEEVEWLVKNCAKLGRKVMTMEK